MSVVCSKPEENKKIGQVIEQLINLENSIDILGESTETLEKILNSVLYTVPTDATCQKTTEDTPLCELADRIRSADKRLYIFIERIRTINSQCQL